MHGSPQTDGQWWQATGSRPLVCPRCGRQGKDVPAVMAYREDFDDGGIQAQSNPRWKRLGWILWRECQYCSWEHHEQPVSLSQIESWRVGPWRPMP